MDKLGIGVVGLGNIARVHLEQLVKQQDAALVGVCDVIPERVAETSAKYDIPGYGTYDELLARPEVGAVLIATPNSNHREATLQALAAGKHVFVEKPMARTARECDEMIAAAEAAGLKLSVGHVLRMMQPFSTILDLVSSGDFGLPRAIEMRRSSFWRKGGPETWRSHRDLMWGLLYEWTIHELDFMRAVCGDVVEVQAVVERLVHVERDAEDIDLVILRFQSGAIGLLRSSTFCAMPVTDGSVQCERGTINWNWGKQRIEYRLAGQAEPTVVQAEVPSFDVAGYGREQAAFVDWVLHDRTPAVGNRDGRAAIEICEAAYLSAERHAPVALR